MRVRVVMVVHRGALVLLVSGVNSRLALVSGRAGVVLVLLVLLQLLRV